MIAEHEPQSSRSAGRDTSEMVEGDEREVKFVLAVDSRVGRVGTLKQSLVLELLVEPRTSSISFSTNSSIITRRHFFRANLQSL